MDTGEYEVSITDADGNEISFEGESCERPDFKTLMGIRMMSEGIESSPYAKMIENGNR